MAVEARRATCAENWSEVPRRRRPGICPDNEPVLALTVGAESGAYPLRVVTWHGILSGGVGGVPVAVIYCPSCNSGVASIAFGGQRSAVVTTSGLL